ncbi:hypothetical protein DFH06DRAFT_1341185 [Mycena polygramma]|nr:hypothetical protein DFH06DRAFT_1341185 [Mycena polygramma]
MPYASLKQLEQTRTTGAQAIWIGALEADAEKLCQCASSAGFVKMLRNRGRCYETGCHDPPYIRIPPPRATHGPSCCMLDIDPCFHCLYNGIAAPIGRVRPETNALIFALGKMVVACKDDSHLASRKHTCIVQKFGFDARDLNAATESSAATRESHCYTARYRAAHLRLVPDKHLRGYMHSSPFIRGSLVRTPAMVCLRRRVLRRGCIA